MNRIDIIQNLIERYHYKSYCEIGVATGECFNKIRCSDKIGIDPDPNSAATCKITSDHFFEISKLAMKFDIFFIDGLHHYQQCLKDIENALHCLNGGGVIVCHDMLPTSEFMQQVPQTTQGEWTGDVWKAWINLRTRASMLNIIMRVVDTDYGCGIITKGFESALYTGNWPINYESFTLNKKMWMNVITEEEFRKIYL